VSKNRNEKGIENDENTTLEACSSNDLATLQWLLDDSGQLPANYQPDIPQASCSGCSLQTNNDRRIPTLEISDLLLLRGVWEHPIYLRKPRCGHTSGALHSRPTLRQHLHRLQSAMLHYRRLWAAPEKIVHVLRVLLDNDADMNDGRLGGGALYAALLGSQPREIIERIVQNGREMRLSIIQTTIQKERLEILQTLLRYGRVRNSDQLEQLVQCAKETENEEAITMVHKFAVDWVKRDGQERMKMKPATRRWWQVWR
jgi:hypothetical protein